MYHKMSISTFIWTNVNIFVQKQPDPCRQKIPTAKLAKPFTLLTGFAIQALYWLTHPSIPKEENTMKVAILAGGFGTRLAEETEIRPKPMVEIGGRPILWHIMKIYAHYGFKDFVIALGYKGEYIKNIWSTIAPCPTT